MRPDEILAKAADLKTRLERLEKRDDTATPATSEFPRFDQLAKVGTTLADIEGRLAKLEAPK